MISDPARRRGDRDSTDPATVLACVWIAIVLALIAAIVLAGLGRTLWMLVSP